MNIIINGTKHRIDGSVALGIPRATFLSYSYNDIIALAGFSAGRSLTVTYRTSRKGDEQRTGVLAPGNTVLIEDGMVFNVVDTSHA